MHPESLHPDDLLGITKHKSQWRLFAGTVAEWILDYASYDPSFDTARSEVIFRGNLLLVTEENVDGFHAAMAPYELQFSELRAYFEKVGSDNWPLMILVDFDKNLYINGFSDISLHEYIPAGWRGIEDVPLHYVPNEIRTIWETISDQPLA